MVENVRRGRSFFSMFPSLFLPTALAALTARDSSWKITSDVTSLGDHSRSFWPIFHFLSSDLSTGLKAFTDLSRLNRETSNGGCGRGGAPHM